MRQLHLRLVEDDEAEATSLERVVNALKRHGFNATAVDAEFRDEDNEYGLEILRFETGSRNSAAEQKRFGKLITEFYDSEHVIPRDRYPSAQLSVRQIKQEAEEYDKSLDDELEFELTFRGLDTLVMMQPEFFEPGERRTIIMRHLAKFDRFAAFLEQRPVD